MDQPQDRFIPLMIFPDFRPGAVKLELYYTCNTEVGKCHSIEVST